jgi:flavin-dependent dehydrogenase
VKTAIAGAGMTGAYLGRLLRNQGQEVDLYGREPGTKCGISPCAWGTSKGFTELVSAAGLDPEKYFLRRFDYLIMDGIRLKAEVGTFDKPALIRDLLQGITVNSGKLPLEKYDRVIDATGIAREFLAASPEDLTLPCVQLRIRTGAELENRIKLGRIGYAWCFPLSPGEYHVGCGSMLCDPRKLLKELGWVERLVQPGNGEILCACGGRVRVTGPAGARPFVRKNGGVEVWGVGEAIGCVAPLAGDGVVPGMRSAQIALENWHEPDKYEEAILREFSWMKSERSVIDKLRGKDTLGLKDAWVLKKNSERMAIQVGLKDAFVLLKNLR